jgi:hydrogenase-4 component F
MILELLAAPLLTILAISLFRSRRAIEVINLAGAAAILLLGLGLVHQVYVQRVVLELGGLLRVDALGAFLILVASLLAFTALLYSHSYIAQEILHKAVGLARLKRYYLLFYAFLFTVFLVGAADNLGILWIALEATTLASAGLVALYTTQESLEAAWKYIIICSVGISLGLFGTVLAYYSSVKILGESSGALNWSTLREIAGQLDPKVMKLAFLFVVVGYGTKAGLAPMHTWLPDAHSQAPSPVSAMLSGILLSCAMYGILRFYIIASAGLGSAYPAMLLLTFGLASLAVSALFLIIQKDYKRMLAYSSVEHMGIIATGLAIGGQLGTYGAILHLFNNAMAKSMMFLAAGNILLRFRTKEIEKVKGVIRLMPVTGWVFLLGAFALTGSPPFSLFISEFTILSAGFSGGAFFASSFMLICLVIIFGGIMYHVNQIVFGPPSGGVERGEIGLWATGPLLIQMFFVVLLGFYIPPFLNEMILRAVQIILGGAA